MTIDELTTELDARETGWQPFPTDALPAPVADLVRAGAKALNWDEALIAALTLPVLAAAVGNSYWVAVKPDWREPAILWLCVLAPSGAEWLRLEYERVFNMLDFSTNAKSDDESLSEKLPDAFTWEDVATIGRVTERQARRIIRRLCANGYAEKIKHGLYRNKTAEETDITDNGGTVCT